MVAPLGWIAIDSAATVARMLTCQCEAIESRFDEAYVGEKLRYTAMQVPTPARLRYLTLFAKKT